MLSTFSAIYFKERLLPLAPVPVSMESDGLVTSGFANHISRKFRVLLPCVCQAAYIPGCLSAAKSFSKLPFFTNSVAGSSPSPGPASSVGSRVTLSNQ